MSGKGDGRRPAAVDPATYADNWARTFGERRRSRCAWCKEEHEEEHEATCPRYKDAVAEAVRRAAKMTEEHFYPSLTDSQTRP